MDCHMKACPEQPVCACRHFPAAAVVRVSKAITILALLHGWARASRWRLAIRGHSRVRLTIIIVKWYTPALIW